MLAHKSPRKPMGKVLLAWAVIGAVVPLFWGILGFVFFTVRQSLWTDIFWWFVFVTCPPWLLPENSVSWLITPIANGLLYVAIAYLALSAVKLMRKA
jgi:hypothetical protein